MQKCTSTLKKSRYASDVDFDEVEECKLVPDSGQTKSAMKKKVLVGPC